MKRITYALLLLGALGAPQAAVAASKTTVGVGTGAVAGALVGGPVGGIVGGYIGATSESPRPRRRRVRTARRAAVLPPRQVRVAQEPARPVPAATGSLTPVRTASAAAKPATGTTWRDPR